LDIEITVATPTILVGIFYRLVHHNGVVVWGLRMSNFTGEDGGLNWMDISG